MPDQTTSFTYNGVYYFVTANEGDTRDGEDVIGIGDEIEGEEIRMGGVNPSCSDCATDENLGRLLTTVFMPSNFAQDACGSQVCNVTEIEANFGST
eukprot:5329780-Prorocentrum_lima.AAC.1